MISEAEELFAAQLDEHGIRYLRQYKFHPERKFMADFCLVMRPVIVELNGGTWMRKSGHSTAKGIHRDYEKSNLAQLMGYVYLQYPTERVMDGSAIAEVCEYLERGEM